jgi:hypothetical protein
MLFKRVKLFGDQVMPGTEYVVLERTLAAFRLMEEATLDRYWYIAEYTASAMPASDRRVWWRISSEGADRFISINPGEYREHPPEADDLVLDLPPGRPKTTCRKILTAAVRSCALYTPTIDRGDELSRIAEQLLKTGEDRASRARFDELVDDTVEAGKSGSPTYHSLLEELVKHQVRFQDPTITHLAATLGLLYLQAATNLWIEESWKHNPTGFLKAFAEKLVDDPVQGEVTRDQICRICDREHEIAQGLLETALKAPSLSAMTRNLSQAALHATIAFSLCLAAPKRDLKLKYPAVILEESLVCIWSGFTYFGTFCTEAPEWQARGLLERCEPTLSALRKGMRRLASPIAPAFTHGFADVIAAQALTLAGPEATQVGIVELERLRELFSYGPDAMEANWIDWALLGAYKKVGRDLEGRSRAARLAVQMIVRKALR